MASASSSGEFHGSGSGPESGLGSGSGSGGGKSSSSSSSSSFVSHDRFEKIRLLGSGAFGEAYLVRSTISQRQYVVKELKLSPNLTSLESESALNEVNIIRKCNHVNIIRYKECFFRSVGPHAAPLICIVMEYADAGDLHDCIRRHRESKKQYFQESQIRNWLVQITFALQYLHNHNILHRDLKTQNIFMTTSRLLKLGDFGVSKTLKHQNDFTTTGIGTAQYLSPEICTRQKYSYKSDIWSLGCVLYEMCALQPAFSAHDLSALVPNIIRGNYKSLPPGYSSAIYELVKVMLRPDPGRRPSSEQLLASKALQDDVLKYMQYINTLPDVLESGRKGSSSSVSSVEGQLSGATSVATTV